MAAICIYLSMGLRRGRKNYLVSAVERTKNWYISKVMEKKTFHLHLQTATEIVVEFTRKHCFNDLPGEYRYVIAPHGRTVDPRGEHLSVVEISVLEEWNLHEDEPLMAEQAVELLWHEGKVPVWIDTTVREVTTEVTILELFCSRRLRGDEELMHGPIAPPFHVQVVLPPDYQKGVLFDVNWKKYSFLRDRREENR